MTNPRRLIYSMFLGGLQYCKPPLFCVQLANLLIILPNLC